MTINIIYYFIFFAGGLSLLFSIGQLLIRAKRLANYNLALMFFCLGVFILQLGLIIRGAAFEHPEFLAFHMTALYLLTPLLYIAYHLVVLPEEALPARWAILLLPGLPAVAADIVYLGLDHEVRMSLLHRLVHSGEGADIILIKLIYLGAAVQITVYLGFLCRKLASIWEKHDSQGILGVTLAYTALSILPVVLLSAAVIMSSIKMLTIASLAVAVMMVGAYFAGQRYPQFLQVLISEAERKRYRKSIIEGIDPQIVIGRLQAVMAQKRLFADEEISLAQVAGEVDITPHQLSHIINERLNINFNAFINQYRIDEAQKLLVRDPEKSVIAVAYEVGFNSKSSFYDAFSRYTGVTPQVYRKKFLRAQ
jgi:AraC-like DNA-binding protein